MLKTRPIYKEGSKNIRALLRINMYLEVASAIPRSVALVFPGSASLPACLRKYTFLEGGAQALGTPN